MTALVKLFWFVDCDWFSIQRLTYSYLLSSPSKGVPSLSFHEMIMMQKCRPPDLTATALRWCQLCLSGPMLTSLHSITRIYNTMFFRSVSAWVYHLSSRLIVYELCPPPLSNEVREPRKRAASVTRMAFDGGEWVRIVNSVLNIKSTNQVQQSLTVSLLYAIDRQWDSVWIYLTKEGS